MNKRNLALIAAFLATSIYGINHTIAKEVMPIYIGSSGFIMLRLLGATSIFWLIGLFAPNPPLDVKTPEITKANNAIPITIIRNIDLFLICPSIAII